MAKNYNLERVVFYPAMWLPITSIDKVQTILLSFEQSKELSINDAIELLQCRKIVQSYPDSFAESNRDRITAAAKNAGAAAFAEISRQVISGEIRNVFEKTELQYSDQFWEALAQSGAFKQVSQKEIESLLKVHPQEVYGLLSNKALVEAFAQPLKEALINNPRVSAELIIREIGTENMPRRNIFLSTLLNNDGINEIMLSYLVEDNPKPNYVHVLSIWPSSAKAQYNPSRDVQVIAVRKNAELVKRAFETYGGTKYGSEIVFDPDQDEPKLLSRCDDWNAYSFRYSTKWLATHNDPGTTLNNFVFIFDFVDRFGLLSMPSHKHTMSALIQATGLHAKDEYPGQLEVSRRNGTSCAIVFSYGKLLESCGCCIEEALSWYYNEYIESEFGIEGFSISLPTKETSYLDKCKSIGPEIERVLKAFSLYAVNGTVDGDYFPHITKEEFLNPPSCLTQNYAVEGPLFEKHGYDLFSDQSLLAYSPNHEGCLSEFYWMIRKEHVVRSDFFDYCQETIDWLIEEGLLSEDENHVLSPTKRADILQYIWHKGAFPFFRCDASLKRTCLEMIEMGWLSMSEMLFTPDESDYFIYMFSNAKYSDSQALRNKYDHASEIIKDSNSQSIQLDYCLLLVLLISATLKINEELCFKHDKGWVEDYVD